MEMKNHPAADAFPMMDEKRFAELVENIRQQGQLEQITICEGMVLDGRNRYKACLELGIEPKTRTFDGDPWAYAWSMNGERRDIVDEQRYLIWKHCSENSAAFKAEKKRIADEANRKRSEAAKVQESRGNQHTPKRDKAEVLQQSVVAPAKRPGQTAKANAAKVNSGAVSRGDKLAKTRPDLAAAVRMGEMRPAEAHREMKRVEVVDRLESVGAMEAKAVSGLYDVIVIDPPWPMKKIERDVAPNQVAFEYPTMSEAEIGDVKIPSAKDCHVWLWTTHKFLPMAFRLLDRWGMKYVCCFTWHKPGGFQPYGLPQYNCEFALYARIGSPQFVDTKAFNVCFNAPRGAHSEKPEDFYAVVKRVTAGRRLDMFNRRAIDGFDGWGKEAK